MKNISSTAKKLAFLGATLALLTLSPCFAQGELAPSMAPLNPAFLDYLQGSGVVQSESVGEQISSGLVPEPIDLTQSDAGVLSEQATVALPVSYDIRPLNKLTAMRDQGNCGSCWDFASVGSLESSLMPGENWNFSENNLKDLAGFDIACCSGGNRTMSTAYFARWNGPVLETDDPYNTSSCSSPSGLPVKRHVQEVIYLPNRTNSLDNDSIKQAVMTYGAIYSTYYHSNSYYKSTTGGYYYTGGGSANHAICIVGWDDNFSASNFLTAPPGNGAFLIRNSWGTWWGSGGYFWMSYYDTILGRTENAVFRAENNNYDTIYQYDTLGWISNTGYGSNIAWFANIFTASTGSLVAASWYTPSLSSNYELYVYLNPTTGPTTGIGPVATKTGALSSAGYHTIALNTPVALTAGQRFSVVVKSITSGYGYPVPLEAQYLGYSSAATSSTGQSYMSSNGSSWTDVAGVYKNANVCLKAFATTSTAAAPGVLSVTPANGITSSGSVGGPFTPSSQAYALTNTGASSINWTAANTQTWVTLSATSGTLAAGATATVTASINTGANTLAAGPYSDTVSFANSTNGNGNTTRVVALTVIGSGNLSVTPATGLASTGAVSGPFTPASQVYTLSNSGGASINWTAAKTQTWVTLSATSGTLAAGATATVTASINSGANSLAAGSYSDTITFTNSTNGVGNTTRGISLSVTTSTPTPGALSVTPATGLTSTGLVGGQFSPASQVYTLANTGGSSINWTAGAAQPWLGLSANSGTLAPGANTTVTVSINSTANTLAAGSFSNTVTFTNTTNGSGNTTRPVSLSISSRTTGAYRIVPTTFGWLNPTSYWRIALGDDSASYAIYIPFVFKFYGNTYNAICVGSNGLMGFGSTGLNLNANTSLPTSYFPNAAIYPYWDNLNPAKGGNVRYSIIGASPKRKMVVSWMGVPSYYKPSPFTFQAILEEGTNDIVFQYLGVAPGDALYGSGRSATIGIENGPGTSAALYSYNKASVTNGMAIRFTTN